MRKKDSNNGTNLCHMEQNLTYEIILVLLNEALHPRAIAQRVKTNHMAIIRKLKTLVDENVLDFRVDGRNKIYFLKKNIEAKSYCAMAEYYKLNRVLRKYPELRKILEAIQNNPSIKLAILFGSYAKGMADEESDIDIFIETKNRNLKRQIEQFNSKLSIKIGVYDKSNPVIKEIEKNHVIIKGVDLFYERSRFFN